MILSTCLPFCGSDGLSIADSHEGLVGTFGRGSLRWPIWVAPGMPLTLLDNKASFFAGHTATFPIVLGHIEDIGLALEVSCPQYDCSLDSDGERAVNLDSCREQQHTSKMQIEL